MKSVGKRRGNALWPDTDYFSVRGGNVCRLAVFLEEEQTVDELRKLIGQYDPYYQMADDSQTWHRGSATDSSIRALVRQLRAEGHGAEIDELAVQYPGLISCPGGAHALA